MRSGANDTIGFDANSNVWRITDVSKPIELSQRTKGMVSSTTKGSPVPNSVSARCGNSYDKVVSSPIPLFATSQNEYVGTTTELSALQVSMAGKQSDATFG
jgi:hypothetical protein